MSTSALANALLQAAIPLGALITFLGVGVAFMRTMRQDLLQVWKESAEAYRDRGDRLEKEKIDLAAANEDLRTEVARLKRLQTDAAEAWNMERQDLYSRIAQKEQRP